jgi:hypothetical protein
MKVIDCGKSNLSGLSVFLRIALIQFLKKIMAFFRDFMVPMLLISRKKFLLRD